MSRTTQAFKRLAVPGLAATTLVAGLPLFLSSASAAAGDTLVLTPEASTAAAGTCRDFTVAVKDSAARNKDTAVTVLVTERTAAGAAATETFDVDFCTTPEPSDAESPVIAAVSSDTTSANDTDRAVFQTGNDGTVTFGLTGVPTDSTGVVDIVAFLDDTPPNLQPDTAEVKDTATFTVTDGGTPNTTASNNLYNPSDSSTANNDVASLDASPDSATFFPGELVTVSVLVKNAAGDTLAGVRPSADIISGPNNATDPVCSSSNNSGVATCSYTSTTTGTFLGTDSIVVWVNEFVDGADAGTANDCTASPDCGESQETVTRTLAARPVGTSIDLTAPSATARTSPEDVIQQPGSNKTQEFQARVTAGDANSPVAGVIVRFTVVSAGAGTETFSPVDVTTDANGIATATLTDTLGVEDEVVTVRAEVRGQSTPATDDGTLTYNTAAANAGTSVVLTPDTTTTAAGAFREFTATVTGANGELIPGATVTVTITGIGRLADGSRQRTFTTGSDGTVKFETTSAANETGTQTVTATIPDTGAGGTTQTRTDSSTNTITASGATPSPSASGTASPRPTGSPSGTPTAPCTNASSVTLNPSTIIATGSAGVTVRATPNSIVDLYAYTRPSTTYRVVRSAELGANGTADFRIVPPANTRLYAQQRGCNASPSVVLNVRTALSLNVTRTGTRAYRFFGDSLPARPGGLIISLYRVTNDGRQVLTSQVRASATTGDWVINRVFTGTGRFGFVVRTGQDLQNAPGASNVRSLLIF